jgi:hypothetical protein
MKNIFATLSVMFCISLSAQTSYSQMSSYQKMTLNTERFTRPVNTGSNHTLMILGTAWDISPEIGDEIAVYDSENNMVASVAWRPEQDGHSALAIWGDDELTSEKEGMLNGEKFSIILYDKSEDALNTINVISWDRGSDTFVKDGLTVISSISTNVVIVQEMELFQNVPNPVIDVTMIGFYLPEDGNVKLTISNTLGQEIFTLANKFLSKGTHNIEFSVNEMSTGVYFYSLESNKNTITKQLTLIK